MFLAPTVSSLMAYFMAILTPNSARSYVMQSTLPTKGMRSIISMISISLKDFLPSILLLMVIIIAVIIVTVIWVVIFVNVIVGVVIVVAIIGVVVVVDALAIDAACAFRAEEMPSLISCRMAAKVMAGVSDVDVLLGGILSTKDNAGYGMIHEDGDNDAIGGNDDERAISWNNKLDDFDLVDDILKIFLIRLVSSLDFLNDSFMIGNSVVSKGNLILLP
ncbi:hypothetical protein Tco_0597010 [Tanacetum coccineum]